MSLVVVLLTIALPSQAVLTLEWLVVLFILLSPALFSLAVLAWTKRRYLSLD